MHDRILKPFQTFISELRNPPEYVVQRQRMVLHNSSEAIRWSTARMRRHACKTAHEQFYGVGQSDATEICRRKSQATQRRNK